MKFHDAPTDENFPLLRHVSEGGRWELGLVPMLFGVRVRLGVVGNGWCALDYCAGPEQADQFFLLGLVAGILSWLPEDLSEAELGAIFPRQKIKPMSLDKECFQRLLGLGKELNKKEASV